MKKQKKKIPTSANQDTKKLMEWPIMAAIVSFLVMLLVGVAIFLWNKWSFVPLAGAGIFIFILSINPIGRYFRLLVSVIGVWVVLILNNAIDFGLNFERYRIFWLKTNEIPWYVHTLIVVVAVILTISDIHVRRPSTGQPNLIPSVTNNRSSKQKMNLAHFIYLGIFSVIAVLIIVQIGGVQQWHPIQETMLNKQKVAIARVADFRGSGCDLNGKPIDVAIFRDIVTLTENSSIYTAFSLESTGQFVEVFDASKSETEPVKPTTTLINGSRYNTYTISVDSNRQANVKYVWKNSHYEFDDKGKGMLGITSKSYLSAASGKILIPEGVNLEPDEKPFNDAVSKRCKTTDKNAFECSNLENPAAVLFSFKWNLWANCRGS